MELFQNRQNDGFNLCVGLDSDPNKIPACVTGDRSTDRMVTFNLEIVKATKDFVCAYKINAGFYRPWLDGAPALQQTISDIHTVAPGIPVILDSKFGDIGNTNDGYIEEVVTLFMADAATVNPYLGGLSLAKFLNMKEKGVIVLCHTSNEGAGELQHLVLQDGRMLYETVAHSVATEWNKNGNCVLVVGATYPAELRKVRAIAPNIPILIPGIGAQQGDLEAAVSAGKDNDNKNVIINVSRGIIFASPNDDYAAAAGREAEKFHKQIQQYLNQQ